MGSYSYPGPSYIFMYYLLTLPCLSHVSVMKANIVYGTSSEAHGKTYAFVAIVTFTSVEMFSLV